MSNAFHPDRGRKLTHKFNKKKGKRHLARRIKANKFRFSFLFLPFSLSLSLTLTDSTEWKWNKLERNGLAGEYFSYELFAVAYVICRVADHKTTSYLNIDHIVWTGVHARADCRHFLNFYLHSFASIYSFEGKSKRRWTWNDKGSNLPSFSIVQSDTFTQ